MANLIWVAERKSGLFSDGYLYGIPEALWFSCMTLMGGDVGCTWQIPRTLFGRFVSALWIFFGIVLIAMFTAELSSAFTEQKLSRSKIEHINDMSGLTMCTSGPFYQAYFADSIRGMGLGIKEYPVDVRDLLYASCTQLLRDKVVDGVLGNREELVDVFNRGEGNGLLVTPIFEKAFYSWLTPPNVSDATLNGYRRSVNVAMLEFREGITGTVPTYEQLVNKYYYGDPTVISKAGLRSDVIGTDWVLYGLAIGVVCLYILLMASTKLFVWWMYKSSVIPADAQSIPSFSRCRSTSERMLLSMVAHLE
eukprot:scaffold323563_cov15-Tisochrysis_lutea.AAC.1